MTTWFHQVLERIWFSFEARNLAAGVIARLRELVGDMPASADHHHSESYGLLQHSLEVAVKMLDEFEKIKTSEGSAQWQYLAFLAGLGHDLGKLFDMDMQAGDLCTRPTPSFFDTSKSSRCFGGMRAVCRALMPSCRPGLCIIS